MRPGGLASARAFPKIEQRLHSMMINEGRFCGPANSASRACQTRDLARLRRRFSAARVSPVQTGQKASNQKSESCNPDQPALRRRIHAAVVSTPPRSQLPGYKNQPFGMEGSCSRTALELVYHHSFWLRCFTTGRGTWGRVM